MLERLTWAPVNTSRKRHSTEARDWGAMLQLSSICSEAERRKDTASLSAVAKKDNSISQRRLGFTLVSKSVFIQDTGSEVLALL